MSTQQLTSNFLRISADLYLYYVESGTGAPLIFIPGWCGTTEFFERYQIPYFARNYRVLCYDPRSQGRSSRTLENNHYIQHGKDLSAFMEALKLKDVVLAGWSAGVNIIYGYIRTFGLKNIKACIFIDQTPKSLMEHDGDWGWCKFEDARDFINATVYDQRGMMRGFFPTLMKGEMNQEILDWAVDQSIKTPASVAAALATDEFFGDFTAEAKAIDGKIPVLTLLNEDWADAAKVWLKANAPATKTHVLGKHAMLWEFPEEANTVIENFLATID